MKTVLKKHVRDFVHLTSEQVWATKGWFSITFDDGVVREMRSAHVKLSWPYWALTRHYDQIAVNGDLCYYEGVMPTDDYHLGLMSKAWMSARQHEQSIDLADIKHLIYKSVYASAYNNTVEHLMSYCTTMDLDPLMEMYYHPLIVQARELLEANPSGVDATGNDLVNEAHNLIAEAFKDPDYKYNLLNQSIYNKTINENSGLQIFVRGKMSDIDSTTFTNPVINGFLNGLNTSVERAKESRAATRSHVYNTDNIADAEYGNRKFQLVCNVLLNHYYDDCGTTHHHTQEFDDTKRDRITLNGMVGMSYRIAGDKLWKPIRREAIDNMVGRTIQFRSSMCCKRMADQGVCRVCYGEFYYSLSKHALPGHLSTASINMRMTQGILSTKHLDFIRIVLKLILDGFQQRYFRKHVNKQTYGISLREKPPEGAWKDYGIVITAEMYRALAVLSFSNAVNTIELTTVPSFDSIIFAKYDEEGLIEDTEEVPVSMGISGYFSHDFLKHYQRVVDNVTKLDRQYVVPMEGYKINRPLVHYLQRSESLSEFADGYETKVRSSQATVGEDRIVKTAKKSPVKTLVSFGGATEAECTAALMDIHHYLERKLPGINLAHIATVLAVSRIEGWDNPYPASGFDTEPADEMRGKRFIDHDTLIGMQSLSSTLFFEKQQNYVDNIYQYTQKVRPEGAYDGAFLMPK